EGKPGAQLGVARSAGPLPLTLVFSGVERRSSKKAPGRSTHVRARIATQPPPGKARSLLWRVPATPSHLPRLIGDRDELVGCSATCVSEGANDEAVPWTRSRVGRGGLRHTRSGRSFARTALRRREPRIQLQIGRAHV